jgi:methylmalonyl-CoA mutase cobalamin-binding domain/chain
MAKSLYEALVELDRDGVLAIVKGKAESGQDPLSILEEGRQGMTTIGDRYQAGDIFLAEMIISAKIFREASELLQPYLAKTLPPTPLGVVVLATPQGDLHDLGKNFFATFLTTKGFEVHDLGVDVAPSAIVEKVRNVRPDFVGFSGLITTVFASMKQSAEALEEAGLRDSFKLLVGGGVTTDKVKEHVGADFQTRDAMEGVEYCVSVAAES